MPAFCITISRGSGVGLVREGKVILIGQYDSPYVRRVAVTMNIYGIGFERRVLSVFADFDAVLSINPLGKVPVLELDDGERLYDSRAILDYVDGLVPPGRRMVPVNEPHRRRVLRVEAVALGLTEKLYDRTFEFARRDPEKRDPVVVHRAERQIWSALAWLEALHPSPWLYGQSMSSADVTTAIAFTYMREKQPALIAQRPHLALDWHCARCEVLPPFKAAAYSAREAERSGWSPEVRAG
jgi:glutathione S-transferase